jgi:formate hydrogenlyase subunit 3/multisubunit Na+/H+ antiporter MnhD subunit
MNALDQVLALSAFTALAGFLLGRQRWAGRALTLLYAGQLGLLAVLGPGLATGGAAVSALSVEVMGTPLHWRMDGLGWFFAIITVGAALFSSWYASGEWSRNRPGMRLFHGALALNVLAMLILLSSGDLLSLFIGWELVSWASYLIMAQSGGPADRAAYRYLVYALGGAMAVLLGLMLAQARFGSLEFDAVRVGLVAASPQLTWVLLALFGAGFAVKMALLPFHLWQAEAYGESPGPAAAFLGAISSRMGLFALLIVLVQLMGPAHLIRLSIPFTGLDARDLWMWLSAFTLIVPTYIALTQNDARLLLAWHGIGQGGYMLLGLMLATPMGVAGGLLHVFNYATYQALLFLSVAAVMHRTGTADLDRLGGLINRMPLSYAAMVLGIIGLAGLPPMNGFVSKWLIYKSLLDAHQPLLFVAAVIGTLGTILSVYKLVHNIFLGQLRVEHAQVREVPWSMSLPMLILGGIAFLTGFFPGLALDLVDVAQRALGFSALPHHLGGVQTPTGSLNMIWVVGVLLANIGIGALIFFLGNRSHRVHQYDNYAGGHFLTTDVRYQYSHHFYAGLLRVIGPWFTGIVQRTEQGLGSLVETLAGASYGVYKTAYTPLLAVATALVIALVAYLRP